MPDGKSIVEVILRLGPEASRDSIDSLKTSIHENDGKLELENGASAKLINVTVLLPGKQTIKFYARGKQTFILVGMWL